MIGSIYFVSDGERIKIGFSVDPAERLRALQVGHGVPLQIVGTFPGNFAMERELHRRFAAHRLVGEWFQAAPDLVAAMNALLADPPAVADRLPAEPGSHREACDRLLAFFRARHPEKTFETVSRLSGAPLRTAQKWGTSFPLGPAFLQLIDLYGPSLLAAVMDPVPDWIRRAQTNERSEEIAVEIARLLGELQALGIDVPPSTGPPVSDPAPASAPTPPTRP